MTVEQASQRYCEIECNKRLHVFKDIDEQIWFMGACKISFEKGAKSPEAKAFHTKGMYSEEEVKNTIREFGHHINRKYNPQHPIVGEVNEWFEQNKKK